MHAIYESGLFIYFRVTTYKERDQLLNSLGGAFSIRERSDAVLIHEWDSSSLQQFY